MKGFAGQRTWSALGLHEPPERFFGATASAGRASDTMLGMKFIEEHGILVGVVDKEGGE